MFWTKNGVAVYDEFSVVDNNDNPVTGLVDGDFTKELYNPSDTEVAGVLGVTVSELGNGLYRVVFTPNAIGQWALRIFNATYFPWGQSANYRVRQSDLDDLYDIEFGRWKIISDQMIFYNTDDVEVARFDLKDAAGNPTMVNVFERDPV